jgi:hypothetical protein
VINERSGARPTTPQPKTTGQLYAISAAGCWVQAERLTITAKRISMAQWRYSGPSSSNAPPDECIRPKMPLPCRHAVAFQPRPQWFKNRVSLGELYLTSARPKRLVSLLPCRAYQNGGVAQGRFGGLPITNAFEAPRETLRAHGDTGG